ncbi:hypothetical protein J4558_12505 [Leptolyngbya sp. 15MV]|nr:hypothetical protein J4558_12505 [Leptolyngbya sp. 15MV]
MTNPAIPPEIAAWFAARGWRAFTSSCSAPMLATSSRPDPAMVAFASRAIDCAATPPDPAITTSAGEGMVTRTVAIPSPRLQLLPSRKMPSVPSLRVKRSASTAAASPSTSMSRRAPSVTITVSGPASTSLAGGSPLMSSSAKGTPSSLLIRMFMSLQPDRPTASAMAAIGASPRINFSKLIACLPILGVLPI